MEKYQVHFVNQDIVLKVNKGETLLAAEITAGLIPDAPCGGNGKCKKCGVKANGKWVLACQCLIHEDMVVEIPQQKGKNNQILMEGCHRPIEFQPGLPSFDVNNPLIAAVDLGTTSVVAYLMDGETGEQIGVRSMMNPQIQYGADVVMRSSYVMENGIDFLSHCAREAVNILLREVARECQRSREEIVRIVIVGNTCMHHIFLKIPVESLVLAPYEPKVKDSVRARAIDYGLMVHPDAELLWLPNIGGFVGADTVSCILTSSIVQSDENILLVDIGTNGEMVLGNRTARIACSAAAGPAFEGAQITCGMRGSKGAIDHVYLDNGELKYHVIGEAIPVGICGSGLLDAAACLLKLGMIDETGRMKKTWYFTEKVFLNQRDIRELQLAKAAIAAGIRLLCSHRGIQIEEISEVQLAGAFGNYLNPDNACAIGLLPKELRDCIQSVGNAAGVGAKVAALNYREFERCKKLAAQTEFLELAVDSRFLNIFVEEMKFPI